MKLKSGRELHPAMRKKQPKRELQDKLVTNVLTSLERKRMLATQGAFSRLARWFGHMASGSTVDLRTPFGANKRKGRLVYEPREAIVARFTPILERCLAKLDPIMGGILRDWETEQASRIGPMSMYLPWRQDGPEKAAAVFKDKPRSKELDNDAWSRALDRLQSLVRLRSIELITPEEAIRGTGDDPEGGMDTGTNSGLPFVIRPWKDTAESGSGERVNESGLCYRWTMDRVKQLIPVLSSKSTPTSKLPYWGCLSGQRLVQKGPKPFSPKSKRLVIAFPKEEAILGKMASVGLVEALKKAEIGGAAIMTAWNPLWHIDQTMQKHLRRAERNGRAVLSGDISNFDATVPPWALWEVGQRIATWFRGGETFVRNLIYTMIYRSWLATPSGIYGPGPSSMKSGSWVTSALGSCMNIAMQFYGEELGLYKIEGLSVLGDDFVLDGPGVSPENTSTTFAHFGMEAHPDKQFHVPRALQFLQRTHILGRLGGIASAMRTLGSILSLEKLSVRPKDWNKFAYEVQALSKLQNVTFHPAFSELVAFVKGMDKLQLGANMSVEELVASSGKAGDAILREQTRQVWKQLGSGVSFKEWTVNGVLRGEILPRESMALFQRVYGKVPVLPAD